MSPQTEPHKGTKKKRVVREEMKEEGENAIKIVLPAPSLVSNNIRHCIMLSDTA